MDAKFWDDVYKTAKPWVLGILFLCLITSIILNPSTYLGIIISIIKIPLTLTATIFTDKNIENFLSIFMLSFFLNFGLKLWNPIKFPLKWSRIFSIFFIFWSLSGIIYMSMKG